MHSSKSFGAKDGQRNVFLNIAVTMVKGWHFKCFWCGKHASILKVKQRGNLWGNNPFGALIVEHANILGNKNRILNRQCYCCWQSACICVNAANRHLVIQF